MKILMTADPLGGGWAYTMELCAGLGEFGVEIALATMGRPLSDPQREEVAALEHVQLHESHYRLCWMSESWDDVDRAGHWLLELEAVVDPDLIHLNDLGHGHLPWQAPMVLVAHSCVCSWWRAVKGEAAPRNEWYRYRQRAAAGCRRANMVVAPSQAMLAAFLSEYGSSRQVQVIYNGRDFPEELLWEQLWRQKEPFCFSAGRLWDEAKNIAALARVAPDLLWEVKVAGEQYGATDLATVEFLGHLDGWEMADQLYRASIYVMPAKYEPFGLSILEAARSGCTLVLGDIPSLREIWGDAACFVNPDDPENLKRALNELAQQPQLREELAQRAWRRAHQYTRARMATEYWQSYQQIMAQARSPSRVALAKKALTWHPPA